MDYTSAKEKLIQSWRYMTLAVIERRKNHLSLLVSLLYKQITSDSRSYYNLHVDVTTRLVCKLHAILHVYFVRNKVTYSLFTWSKHKWLFWRAGLYSANQSVLKSSQRAPIGWKKAGPLNSQKKIFCGFDDLTNR